MIIIALGLWLTISVGIAFWTDRTLDFWLSFFAHRPIDVPWILSYAVTFVCNGFIVLVNVLSEVIRYAM